MTSGDVILSQPHETNSSGKGTLSPMQELPCHGGEEAMSLRVVGGLCPLTECTICLEGIKNPKTHSCQKCSSKFCHECFHKWVETCMTCKNRCKCPVCRIDWTVAIKKGCLSMESWLLLLVILGTFCSINLFLGGSFLVGYFMCDEDTCKAFKHFTIVYSCISIPCIFIWIFIFIFMKPKEVCTVRNVAFP